MFLVSRRQSFLQRELVEQNANTALSDMLRISSWRPYVINFSFQVALEDFLWKIQTGWMTQTFIPESRFLLGSYKSVHVFLARSFLHSSVQYSIV